MRRAARRAATARACARALADAEDAARGSDNLMPPILEAARAYATLGEMCDALREVFGRVRGAAVF